MTRTGRGGYKPKQAAKVGGWLKGARVKARAVIALELAVGGAVAIGPSWLEAEEHPRAGLLRYIRHGRHN